MIWLYAGVKGRYYDMMDLLGRYAAMSLMRQYTIRNDFKRISLT
jgi:hypothetical protein